MAHGWKLVQEKATFDYESLHDHKLQMKHEYLNFGDT